MNDDIRRVPLDRVAVLNPHDLDDGDFAQLARDIGEIGLKKPVVVTPRVHPDGAECFLLVCGERRLRALWLLGETEALALVKHISDEDALLMRLSENIARRRAAGRERIWPLRHLRNLGHSERDIAAKTGLDSEWVHDMLILLEHDDKGLIDAAYVGDVPMSVAISIARAGHDRAAGLAAMRAAFEAGHLTAEQFIKIQRTLEARQGPIGQRIRPDLAPSVLMRTLMGELRRKRDFVKRAAKVRRQLAEIVDSVRRLRCDEIFMYLVRAEGLDAMPTCLAERLRDATADQ